MHIVILHGYILQGTGSNIYVANIAKAWKKQGHKVTILCQDRNANKLPFIDEFILGTPKKPLTAPKNGSIRVIVPNINNILPVYVLDEYNGYIVKTIQTMSDKEINNHINMVADTLKQIYDTQHVDKVFANHALLSPAIALKALKGTTIPYDIKIHGSAIEFSLVAAPRLMKYVTESIENANNIIAGSQHIKNRIIKLCHNQIDLCSLKNVKSAKQIEKKIKIIPPGMDPELFKIADNFSINNAAFITKTKETTKTLPTGRHFKKIISSPNTETTTSKALQQSLINKCKTYNQRIVDSDLLEKWNITTPNEPIIFYFGKFLQTKGIGELLAIAPHIISKNPKVKFIFSGFGTYREHMEQLLDAFSDGDLKKAIKIGNAGNFITEIAVKRYFMQITEKIRKRIIITGFLNHNLLSKLLPMSSICMIPSRLSEAFGMVAVEAMSCGVIPICNNHSGLKDILKILKIEYPELTSHTITEQDSFFKNLPETIENTLKFIYPKGYDDHTKINKIRKQLRNTAIKNFSWNKIAGELL
jgi:glycosyltransferase involved in cell wall biosynthesis